MVKATPLVYSSVRKTHFLCKTPIFCANLIEIRVKRSKVKVIKWSYLNSPDRLLTDQITGFVVKQCTRCCQRLYLKHIVLQRRLFWNYLSRGYVDLFSSPQSLLGINNYQTASALF